MPLITQAIAGEDGADPLFSDVLPFAVATKFCIGTASWTDPGFIEDLYPPKLPKSQLFRWYAGHFNCVK